ncbi:hypothetical protein [Ramlibacter sp.]|uniref:hypothetical protein n=1 Tax=Ramlibacter sp. TaxID=1917967 RepID=UPI002FCB9E35
MAPIIASMVQVVLHADVGMTKKMEQDGPAPGAANPADPSRAETGRTPREESQAAERTWGKGAATALEQLRRNDYGTRRVHPGEDRPKSE